MDEGHGFGLAAQGVLQELSELGVAEGDVVLLGGQGGHHITQCAQALVDVLGLLQPVPSRFALAHPLTACTARFACNLLGLRRSR